MSWIAPIVAWIAGNQPLHTDFNRMEGNTAVLGNLRAFPTAGGTGTAITVTTGYFELAAGRSFTFVASANNSGAATTLNADGLGAKNLYKPGGTDAPTIISGKAYTVWYNGTSFFVKASSTGTATVGQVLAGVPFSNEIDTDLIGEAPINSGDVAAVSSHSGGAGTIHVVPALGYVDGSDDASVITDADFLAANIKYPAEIFGLTGTFIGNLAVGDFVLYSDLAEGTGTQTDYTKVIDVDVKFPGTYRIAFDLNVSNFAGSGEYVYGRVYVDGSPVGTERINGTYSYITYSQDIALAAGQNIQLYVKKVGATVSYYFKNFYIKCESLYTVVL